MSDKNDEDIFAELMGSDVAQVAPEPVPAGDAEPVTEVAEQEQIEPVVSEAQNAESELPEDVKQKLARLAEVEENFNKLQRDYQAVHGRLAPMQRKIAEYEHAAKASPPANAAPPQSSEQSTGNPLQDLLTQIEEDYGKDIAAAFRAERQRVEELQQELKQMRSAFEPVAQQIGFQTEVQRLTQAHPDWQEINQSEDFGGFVDWWWSNQPTAIRASIGGEEGLQRALNNAEFSISLLNQYKALRQQAQPAAQNTPQPPKPSAQTGRRAISAAPNVRSSGMPPAVDMRNLPEEDQFAILWAQAGNR